MPAQIFANYIRRYTTMKFPELQVEYGQANHPWSEFAKGTRPQRSELRKRVYTRQMHNASIVRGLI